MMNKAAKNRHSARRFLPGFISLRHYKWRNLAGGPVVEAKKNSATLVCYLPRPGFPCSLGVDRHVRLSRALRPLVLDLGLPRAFNFYVDFGAIDAGRNSGRESRGVIHFGH